MRGQGPFAGPGPTGKKKPMEDNISSGSINVRPGKFHSEGLKSKGPSKLHTQFSSGPDGYKKGFGKFHHG